MVELIYCRTSLEFCSEKERMKKQQTNAHLQRKVLCVTNQPRGYPSVEFLVQGIYVIS